MAAPISKEQFLRELNALGERAWLSATHLGREEMREEIFRKLAPSDPKQVSLFDPKPASPQKVGAQGRAEHGSIKNAVRRTVYDHPQGITRGDMFKYSRDKLGVTIKDGSMKQALRILRLAKDIHNRDGKWFPSRDE